jgi:Sulfotransferase domain.
MYNYCSYSLFCRLWEDIPEVGVGRHVKQTFGKYFVHLADLASHPRILRTHLSSDKAPVHPKSKIIYISRNPFDTALSLYKENKTINEFSGNFADFFTYFLHGQTDYNDYFEHHKGWHNRKASQHILWLTYEELKQYPRAVIKKLGDYLGGIYERNANDDFIVKEVVTHSCLAEMKVQEQLLVQPNPNRLDGYSFFQEGAVGNYTQFFTKEQVQQLSDRFARQFAGTPFMSTWKKHGLPISANNTGNINNNNNNNNIKIINKNCR